MPMQRASQGESLLFPLKQMLAYGARFMPGSAFKQAQQGSQPSPAPPSNTQKGPSKGQQLLTALLSGKYSSLTSAFVAIELIPGNYAGHKWMSHTCVMQSGVPPSTLFYCLL